MTPWSSRASTVTQRAARKSPCCSCTTSSASTGRATRRLHVLNGVRAGVWAGQSVALVAPSGAGKSTLLHIAGLLEHPDHGEVYIDGRATAILPDARAHPHPPQRDRLRLPVPSSAARILRAGERDAAADDPRPDAARRPRKRATELLSYLGLARAAHPPAGGAFRRRAAARRDRARGRQCAAHSAGRRADRQSRRAHRRPRVRGVQAARPRFRPRHHHRHPQHGSRRAHGPAGDVEGGAGGGDWIKGISCFRAPKTL